MSQNIARRPEFGVTVAQIRLSSEGPVTCDELTVEILQYAKASRRGLRLAALAPPLTPITNVIQICHI